MKNIVTVLTVLTAFTISVALVGCSDDDSEHASGGHSHFSEIASVEKHKFEHEFAKQCVDREVSNSANKNHDRKRFEEPCLCIAEFMMKDLTDIEAEKFLAENKNAQSLRIRFDSAAYHCLQGAKQPQEPVLFGKR
ncbi:MAG: hypothetical protein V3V31_05850 [Methylococcales bacterium]